jgi:hypothetical protein
VTDIVALPLECGLYTLLVGYLSYPIVDKHPLPLAWTGPIPFEPFRCILFFHGDEPLDQLLLHAKALFLERALLDTLNLLSAEVDAFDITSA